MAYSTTFLELNRKNTSIIVFLASVFVVNPLLGLMASYLWIATSGSGGTRGYAITKFYCIALGVFLGAVNASKMPENDLVWYYEGFLDAGKFGLLEYISTFGINGQGRELAFPLFNYLIYQMVGPNTQFYILIITTLYYGLINLSIFKLCKSLNQPPLVIATAVFLFAIAPNIFSLSAVILRQNLATALIIYIIVERFTQQKNHYWLMMLAVLTHASSLFFLALCFMPGIRKRLSLKNAPLFLIIVFGILTYQYLAVIAAGFFSGNSVISYALTRASTGTTYELPPLGVVKILFNTVLLMALLLTIYKIKPSYKGHSGVVAISNIVLLTLFFIISNLNYVELSVRFNFYYLSFFPVIVAIVLSGFPQKTITPLLVSTHPAFLVIFIYGLYTSMWTYAANVEVAYWPLPFYFWN